jgi:hypothetical protein
MANQEQVEMLKRGVEEWNQWRKDNPDMIIDLSLANFSGADLTGIDLNGANLSGIALNGADLIHADLSTTTLVRASLILADLSSANLNGADMRGSDLSGADLDRADLRNADLDGADLEGTHFHNAKIGSTTFADLDLRSVQGLDTLTHKYPSELGVSTIYRSNGQIPDIFLRGCGIPDDMIGYIHSIAGAIQYYTVFISYNNQDDLFVSRLFNDLQGAGVRCWKYTEHVKIGDRIYDEVDPDSH